MKMAPEGNPESHSVPSAFGTQSSEYALERGGAGNTAGNSHEALL